MSSPFYIICLQDMYQIQSYAIHLLLLMKIELSDPQSWSNPNVSHARQGSNDVTKHKSLNFLNNLCKLYSHFN